LLAQLFLRYTGAMSLQKNLDRAATLKFPTEAVIDGKLVGAKSGKSVENIVPRDGKVLNQGAESDAEENDAAVKAARAAFEKGTWANMPPANRKRIMLKLAELMMKNREELALLETLDMGKPIRDSSSIDIPGSAN
jgi:acyl-CoA reductase-like NAD-dependent aldehyde dehydrogenase